MKKQNRQHSIIQSNRESYLTGKTCGILDPHEPIGGHNRKISLKEGLWIWVTRDEHDWLHETEEGQIKDAELSALMEREWYKHTGKSKEDWYRLFYKHYDLD